MKENTKLKGHIDVKTKHTTKQEELEKTVEKLQNEVKELRKVVNMLMEMVMSLDSDDDYEYNFDADAYVYSVFRIKDPRFSM